MKQLMRAILFFLLAGILAGCGPSKHYYQVRYDLDVNRFFQAAEADPRYDYFYYGPTSDPIALLALSNDYVLRSSFWTPFAAESGQWEEWLDDFAKNIGKWDDVEHIRIDYDGLAIIGDNGDEVGKVYTRYNWIVAWRGEGNEIIIAPPEPKGTQRAPRALLRRSVHD